MNAPSQGHLAPRFSIRSLLAFPFWNRSEQRIRWGYRSLIPMVLAIVILFVAGILGFSLGAALAAWFPAIDPQLGGWFISNVAKLILTLLLMLFWARVVDRREVAAYGFRLDRSWWRQLLAGLLLGASIPSLTTLIMVATGWAELRVVATLDTQLLLTIGLVVVSALCIGLWEEILFRGIAFKNAAEGLRGMRLAHGGAAVGAWVLTSLGFALYHWILVRDSAVLPYYLVSSCLIGLGYLLTGQLAWSIGLHAMYDLLRGFVFVVDSGDGLPALTNIERTINAPLLLTGPVALLEILVIVAGVLLIAGWSAWRGKLRPSEDAI